MGLRQACAHPILSGIAMNMLLQDLQAVYKPLYTTLALQFKGNHRDIIIKKLFQIRITQDQVYIMIYPIAMVTRHAGQYKMHFPGGSLL